MTNTRLFVWKTVKKVRSVDNGKCVSICKFCDMAHDQVTVTWMYLPSSGH